MSDRGCHTVLIVDDERTIADTLALIFSTRCGYETRAVYTAEEAMNMLAEWSPDLAIVDVVLPQMNGIDQSVSRRTERQAIRTRGTRYVFAIGRRWRDRYWPR
jgi:DNA-binding response OmpR family regulator